MDAVLLSRFQFALTVGFHFLFPPLTIGLAWLIVGMMGRYKRTRSEFDRSTARFWIKLFALSFVIGVATGITMEFQFGTNWAAYSRFVGDIFGAPLAAEAIFAFFLESTFLAVMVFGWNRVSVGVQWFSSLMVAVGSTLSAFWIIVANSWQQTPAGYKIAHGRAELTDFQAAVFNASTPPRFLHTLDGAMITASLFVLGISAVFFLRRRHIEFAKRSISIALIAGFIASAAQLPLGHYSGRQVAETQPAKLAAFEALFATQTRAPAKVFCFINPDRCETRSTVEIPGMLSWLATGRLNGRVQGLQDFPRSEWPPVRATFYPFHLMVALGMYFIGLTALGVFLWWRGMLFQNRLFMKAALISIPLPFIANELGWVVAEVGRQPWIVYGLLKTKDAVSVTVPAGQILFSIIMFCLIYTLLFTVWIRGIRRVIDAGPETAAPEQKKSKGVPA